MTDRELNEKLRQAYEHATPDVLDAVLSDCNEQKGRVVSMTTEKKKRSLSESSEVIMVSYPKSSISRNDLKAYLITMKSINRILVLMTLRGMI